MLAIKVLKWLVGISIVGFIVGSVIPELINAKSSLSVLGGVALIFGLIFLVVLGIEIKFKNKK